MVRFISTLFKAVAKVIVKAFPQISESGLISPNATPPLSKQLLRSKSIASTKDTLLIRYLRSNLTNQIRSQPVNQSGKTARRCRVVSQSDLAASLRGILCLGFTETWWMLKNTRWEALLSLKSDGSQVESASTNNLEGSRKELRSSDPELETIPYRLLHTPPTFQ